jgi:hypothetical protein
MDEATIAGLRERVHPGLPPMMKTGLLKTIAKSTFALIAALAVFAAARPSGNVQAVVDIPSLYAEIAGDYEFYLGLRYMVISVSQDQGKLWGRAPGDPKARRGFIETFGHDSGRALLDIPGIPAYELMNEHESCRQVDSVDFFGRLGRRLLSGLR